MRTLVFDPPSIETKSDPENLDRYRLRMIGLPVPGALQHDDRIHSHHSVLNEAF